MLRWAPLTILGVCVGLAMAFAVRGGALDADGPLHEPGGFGGVSIDAAGRGESEWLTAGDIFLCTDRDDSSVRLVGVRVDGPVQPTQTRFYVRRVPAATAAHGRLPDRFNPIGALRGLPPDFDRPHGRRTLGGGHWSTRVSETQIPQTCRDQERSGRGFTELLLSIRAGAQGAQVQDLWVDYDSDQGRATMHTQGSAIICGSAITEPGVCGNPDE